MSGKDKHNKIEDTRTRFKMVFALMRQTKTAVNQLIESAKLHHQYLASLNDEVEKCGLFPNLSDTPLLAAASRLEDSQKTLDNWYAEARKSLVQIESELDAVEPKQLPLSDSAKADKDKPNSYYNDHTSHCNTCRWIIYVFIGGDTHGQGYSKYECGNRRASMYEKHIPDPQKSWCIEWDRRDITTGVATTRSETKKWAADETMSPEVVE